MVMMRVLALCLLMLCSPAYSQQDPSPEQILGAIAGGALGSTVGDGDGRKAATVIGAIIGWRMGERVLSQQEHRDFVSLNNRELRDWCHAEVPAQYASDRRLASAWISGCVRRLENQQKALERQAYLDGLAP